MLSTIIYMTSLPTCESALMSAISSSQSWGCSHTLFCIWKNPHSFITRRRRSRSPLRLTGMSNIDTIPGIPSLSCPCCKFSFLLLQMHDAPTFNYPCKSHAVPLFKGHVPRASSRVSARLDCSAIRFLREPKPSRIFSTFGATMATANMPVTAMVPRTASCRYRLFLSRLASASSFPIDK